MKTAEEVAEEILNKQKEWASGLFYVRGPHGFRTYLKEALTAYAEERVKEVQYEESKVWAPKEREMLAKSRAEALEEAAAFMEAWQTWTPDHVQILISKIRALKGLQ